MLESFTSINMEFLSVPGLKAPSPHPEHHQHLGIDLVTSYKPQKTGSMRPRVQAGQETEKPWRGAFMASLGSKAAKLDITNIETMQCQCRESHQSKNSAEGLGH